MVTYALHMLPSIYSAFYIAVFCSFSRVVSWQKPVLMMQDLAMACKTYQAITGHLGTDARVEDVSLCTWQTIA